jgi:hypothetical protein
VTARHAPARVLARRRQVIDVLLVVCGILCAASPVAAFAQGVAPDAHPVSQQPALPTEHADGTSDFVRAALTPEPAVIPTIGVLPPETVTETETRTVTATRTAAAPRASTSTVTETRTATETVTRVETRTATETATVTVTETVPVIPVPEQGP